MHGKARCGSLKAEQRQNPSQQLKQALRQPVHHEEPVSQQQNYQSPHPEGRHKLQQGGQQKAELEVGARLSGVEGQILSLKKGAGGATAATLRVPTSEGGASAAAGLPTRLGAGIEGGGFAVARMRSRASLAFLFFVGSGGLGGG